MSFSLMFWHASGVPSPEVALDIYLRLSEGEVGVVPESDSVRAFYADVLSEFGDLTEGNVHDDPATGETVPWMAPIGYTPESVIVQISWSRYMEVAHKLCELAGKYELMGYDPQDNEVLPPY